MWLWYAVVNSLSSQSTQRPMSMTNSRKHHREDIHFVLWCDIRGMLQHCIVFVFPRAIISLRCNPISCQLGPNFNTALTWINYGWIAETYANTALWNSQGAQTNVCFGTALPRDLNWEIAASIDRARVSTMVLASDGTNGLSTHKWRATLWTLRHPQNPNSSISSAGVLWRWKCSQTCNFWRQGTKRLGSSCEAFVKASLISSIASGEPLAGPTSTDPFRPGHDRLHCLEGNKPFDICWNKLRFVAAKIPCGCREHFHHGPMATAPCPQDHRLSTSIELHHMRKPQFDVCP